MAVSTSVRRLAADVNGRQRGALVLLLVLAVVHLGAQLAPAGDLADRSQWFLMPALALVVVVSTVRPRTRRVRLVLAALGLSWLGDTVPDLVPEDLSFVVMIGLFLLAQVCYVVAFTPGARRSAVLRRPVLLLPYVVVLGVLVAVCAPGAGPLLGPVVVYGTCLTAMAVLATGLGRVGGIGGAVFLVSDSLIALGAFVDHFRLPLAGFWVMATYLVGQCLLVVAVLDEDRDHRGGAGPSEPGQPTAWTGAGSGTPDPSLR